MNLMIWDTRQMVKKLLINEANLVFHIDATAMATAKEPNRVYLYDSQIVSLF
jgi:hypothetical protein